VTTTRSGSDKPHVAISNVAPQELDWSSRCTDSPYVGVLWSNERPLVVRCLHRREVRLAETEQVPVKFVWAVDAKVEELISHITDFKH